MDLANQENQVDLYYLQIKRINDALNKDEQLLKYIESPDYTSSEKKAQLQKKFKNRLENAVLYALFLVRDQIPRSHVEKQLIHEFLSYYYSSRGITYGTVYSASPLDDMHLVTLELTFSKKLAREVKFENKIDKDLIGGVKVVINDNVWDGSYKIKMEKLKQSLLNQNDVVDLENITSSIIEDINLFDKSQIETQSTYTTGYVDTVGDGIVNLSGIYKAMSGELLQIGKHKAMVMDLEEERIQAALLSDGNDIVKGMEVNSTGKVVEVPVGDALLGRVIDALGNPIDGKGSIKADDYYPIEVPAPGIIDRQPVNQPLQTGIKIIDSMIPIGKGQRELIIGDRQTGKTALAIDTIINQHDKNVKCIYVAIGQKNSTVAQIVDKLKQYNALSYTTVLVAGASEMPSLQYIAPYAGCSIGEYWMKKGEDVLIVYDDLSKHAIAYRTLSLLLRRPAGREAYPGDVFYLHSRLLERSGRLSEKLGGGSLTALPIIETQAGDISAYIPTNVISITDGQIFLQSDLFNSGVRPAIDYGLSVSRVGSAAQVKAMKKVSSSLKLDLSQYQEVLDFAQFGSDLDPATRKQINHGRHLTELLKQPQYMPMSLENQIILLLANKNGLVDNIELNDVQTYQNELIEYVNITHPDLIKQLIETQNLDQQLENSLVEAIATFSKAYHQEGNKDAA